MGPMHIIILIGVVIHSTTCMPCQKCQSATATTGGKCQRLASCRIGCRFLCWQHARPSGVFTQRGSQCSAKLLQTLDTIRRPFKGLGKNTYGISGSLTVHSMQDVFNVLLSSSSRATFVDVGAADGYAVLLALLHGYPNAYGIEYSSTTGLQTIYDHLWLTMQQRFPYIFSHPWSPAKPLVHFGTSVADFKFYGDSLHVFSFWDGFSHSDSLALLQKLAAHSNRIERVCLVRRSGRPLGTFPKIQQFLPSATFYTSFKVRYAQVTYLATVFTL